MEINITYNNDSINNGNNNTTVLIHTYSTETIIDIIKYLNNTFQSRFEYKKSSNTEYGYLNFSLIIPPSISLSGETIFPFKKNYLRLNIELLKEKSTSIQETYNIIMYGNHAAITHFFNHYPQNITKTFLSISPSNFQTRILSIIDYINLTRKDSHQSPISIDFNFNRILTFEERLIAFLQKASSIYPELSPTLDTLKPKLRSRIKN